MRGHPAPPTYPAHSRLAYMPGIDGIRTLAVATVFIFHAGAMWFPGGFLGVDVFFVVSGYLITALLLAEQSQTGRIDLIRFWMRRIRRLLPALLATIIASLAAMIVLHPDEVDRLRGAVVSSLLYVTNWYFIVADVPYSERFERPNLFTHLWSLAVEEQFYLIWPLVMVLVLVALKLRAWTLGAIAIVGFVACSIWAGMLYDPYELPWRIYYGTDTRAVGLLVGVLVAVALPPGRLRPVVSRVQRFGLDIIGLLGLAGVLATMLLIDSFHAPLYRGGLLVLSAFTLALLLAVAHPASLIGRAFAVKPLRWLGERSYGIYLWHWPVLMLTRGGIDVPLSGPVLWIIQIALSVGIAALSYRYLEVPVRRHGLAPIREALSVRGAAIRAHPGRTLVAWGCVAVTALVVLVLAGIVPDAIVHAGHS